MKRAILVCVTVMAMSAVAWAEDLEWKEVGTGITGVSAVAVEPQAKAIFIAQGKNILRSDDAGVNFREVYRVTGALAVVNALCIEPRSRKAYAATGNGVYMSDIRGNSWRRIFKGKTDFANVCTAIAVSGKKIVVETQEGLFISRDEGSRWEALRWNRHEAPQEELSDLSEGGEEEKRVYCAVFSGETSEAMYVGTNRGVYEAKGLDAPWHKITEYGLLNRMVTGLTALSEGGLCAVTPSGIYRFRNERWEEQTIRLAAHTVRGMAIDAGGHLYAATENGLFKSQAGRGDATQKGSAGADEKEEPTIRQVQQAAIAYAEVQPEKIALWRRQAGMKALLPTLSTGIRRDAGDMWHWESGSTTKAGDDLLVKGRDVLTWDVSLSWDLGELIWNNDQTSIDARSRLAVQLREDILDEATKVYFERLRVMKELASLNIDEMKKRDDKALRVEELTARLDALTGGYFSGRLNKASPQG